MAIRRYPFFIGLSGTRPNNNPASYYDCDTVSELPTAGAVVGDIGYARDTDLMYFNGMSGWSQIDAGNSASTIIEPTSSMASIQNAINTSSVIEFMPNVTYSMTTTMTLPDRDQTWIIPAGTVLSWSNDGVAILGPNGLTDVRNWRFEGGGALRGDSTLTAQKLLQLNDSNGRGWPTFRNLNIGKTDASPALQFRTLVDIADHDATFTTPCWIEFHNCDIPAPYVSAIDDSIAKVTDANSPKLCTTPDAAGTLGGSSILKFIMCRLGSYIGANPHRWYMSADVDFEMFRTSIFLGGNSKWNGSAFAMCYIKLCEQAAHTPSLYISYGAGWIAHVDITDCYFNEASGGGGSCLELRGGYGEKVVGGSCVGVTLKLAAINQKVTNVVIDGQVIGALGDLQATCVEVTANNCTVEGCTILNASANLIHLNGSSRGTVSANNFVPVGAEKTIRETTGNNNAISGNNGVARGGGLALNGAATIAFEAGKNLS